MAWEFAFLDWVQTLRTPVLDRIMVELSAAGNGGILWIILAAVLIVSPKNRKCGILIAAALIVDVVLCNGILKNLVGRIRPCDVNMMTDLLIPRPVDYSFPSGHTAASFAAAGALYLSGRKKLYITAFILAAMIAFSRMYLYVHYPTDILGGIAVGLVSAYIGWKMVSWVDKKYTGRLHTENK